MKLFKKKNKYGTVKSTKTRKDMEKVSKTPSIVKKMRDSGDGVV